MVYLYALLAAIIAIGWEVLYRYTNYNYWSLAPFVGLTSIVIGYCVYKIVTGTDHFIEIAIIFPLATMSARVLASWFVFGERVHYTTYIALSLVIGANLIRVLLK